MKILLTGASGQLGSQLKPLLLQQGYTVAAPSSQQLDFLQPQQVETFLLENPADWVINCAAYTAVDAAESHRQQADLINTDSVAAIGRAVHRTGGRVLHVSTDYVFSGRQGRPYNEDDLAEPVNYYGYSKHQGELKLLQELPQAIIVRTAWLYSQHGENFINKILSLAAQKSSLTVVDDQFGSPTWAADLAAAILQLLSSNYQGIVHYSNEGIASWYDVAQFVVHEAKRLGMPVQASVLPRASSDLTMAAQRPANGVMSKQRVRSLLSEPIPHWQCSLAGMLAQRVKNQNL